MPPLSGVVAPPRRHRGRHGAERPARASPQACIESLGAQLGLELPEAVDHFEAQGAQDVLVELSGARRVVAVS